MITPFGEAAFLVEVDDAQQAQGFCAALAHRRPPGVRAAVPGRASVLVEVDPLEPMVDELPAVLRALLAVPAPPRAHGRLRDIPVVYGGEHGPDLPAVAAAAGIAPDEVVARHTQAELRVLFVGFAPGFAYMGGLDASLTMVRRMATPRTRTPAGSVAIADGMSGVYPADLPGGWPVIGRTPAALFDPWRDPPAYLLPGDRVRFRALPGDAWRGHGETPVDW